MNFLIRLSAAKDIMLGRALLFGARLEDGEIVGPIIMSHCEIDFASARKMKDVTVSAGGAELYCPRCGELVRTLSGQGTGAALIDSALMEHICGGTDATR